jgi:cell shape-determining protein MreC
MKFGDSIITVITAIIGVAIISVLVSKQANTSGVLQSAGSAFSQVLGAAVNPVSNASGLGNLGGF